MDLSDVVALVDTILKGGPQAIIALLMFVILGLIWDRRNLTKLIEAKDTRIDDIIDNYQAGQVSITDALKSLAVVLAEIKGRVD